LARLVKASSAPADKIANLIRQADLTAEGLDDAKQAIDLYERVLSDFDAKNDAALTKIASLYEKLDDAKGRAAALERRLTILEEPSLKLEVAESLAQLYEGPLDDAPAAVRVLDIERVL